MNSENIKNKINQLKTEIEFHNKKYYEKNSPLISDREYDKLLNKLKNLENKYPEFITQDSPTQKVGDDRSSKFKTVQHRKPLKSLDNTYSENDLLEWDQRIKKNLQGENIEYIVELKIDGAAVSLLYENGNFIQAISRGNGIQGDDITHNVKTIKNLPLKLNKNSVLSKISFDVRGEIFMPKKVFNELNSERQQLDISLFANPRNAAAGSLKQLDSNICKKRKLDIFIHSPGYFEQLKFDTHFNFLNECKNSGLPVSKNIKKFSSIQEVIEYCQNWEEKRNSLFYEIDGMVVKANSLAQQDKLGYTSKYPRFAISYKFAAEQGISKIKKVKMQVGRTGNLTPVAIFDPPVLISGSTVKHATLHNEDFIKQLDIKINDTVIIEKAGEIIPQVVNVKKDKRTGNEKNIIFPDKCPVCQSNVIKLEDEAKHRCINPDCSAQRQRKLEHYISKNFGVDITGGTKTVELLLKNNLIKNISDFYFLKKEELKDLENWGEKSSENFIESINNSKKAGLSKIISGLGIPLVGSTTAEILVKELETIDNLINAEFETLKNIDGVGPKIGESIIKFFSLEKNLKLIERLKQGGVEFITDIKKENNKSNISNKTFVITGKLKSGKSRNELKNIVKKLGGKVTNSISASTDYLIADSPSNSKKFKDAGELNISIITEKEFNNLL